MRRVLKMGVILYLIIQVSLFLGYRRERESDYILGTNPIIIPKDTMPNFSPSIITRDTTPFNGPEEVRIDPEEIDF